MFQREPGHDPHKALWQAVLRLAVDDALLGPGDSLNRQSFLSECAQARAFLTTTSEDLLTVCHHAGVNPRAVLEAMRARIAEAPTPEELHDQPRPHRNAIPKRPPKPKPIAFPDRPFVIDGTTRTATEWCERTGVSLQTAQRRLGQGWAAERAFTMTRADVRREHRARVDQSIRTVMQRKGRKKRAAHASTPRYEHNGESLTLLEWSDRTGIKKSTLYKRVVLSGWTLGEALTTRDTRHHRFAEVS